MQSSPAPVFLVESSRTCNFCVIPSIVGLPHPAISKALGHCAECLIIVILLAAIVYRSQFSTRRRVFGRYNRLNDLTPRSRFWNSRLVARPPCGNFLRGGHLLVIPMDTERWAD